MHLLWEVEEGIPVSWEEEEEMDLMEEDKEEMEVEMEEEVEDHHVIIAKIYSSWKILLCKNVRYGAEGC